MGWIDVDDDGLLESTSQVVVVGGKGMMIWSTQWLFSLLYLVVANTKVGGNKGKGRKIKQGGERNGSLSLSLSPPLQRRFGLDSSRGRGSISSSFPLRRLRRIETFHFGLLFPFGGGTSVEETMLEGLSGRDTFGGVQLKA